MSPSVSLPLSVSRLSCLTSRIACPPSHRTLSEEVEGGKEGEAEAEAWAPTKYVSPGTPPLPPPPSTPPSPYAPAAEARGGVASGDDGEEGNDDCSGGAGGGWPVDMIADCEALSCFLVDV